MTTLHTLTDLHALLDTIQTGDIILMQVKADEVNHAAVYLGDGVMLHHLYNRLSDRTIYGGMWAEVTRKIVRLKTR